MSSFGDYDITPYFISAVTVDNVIFGFDGVSLRVLLVERGVEPYSGMWALPGEFVLPDEDLDTAAARVLRELTGLEGVYLEQVESFGEPGRHPEGRVVTIAYYSLIRERPQAVVPKSWARQAGYFAIDDLPAIAFDHRTILMRCLHRLRERVRSRPIGFELLPEKFSLSDLQALYESIIGEPLDKRNFRKKILSMGVVTDTGEVQENVSHRPAKLYRFDERQYERLRREGFSFAV